LDYNKRKSARLCATPQLIAWFKMYMVLWMVFMDGFMDQNSFWGVAIPDNDKTK